MERNIERCALRREPLLDAAQRIVAGEELWHEHPGHRLLRIGRKGITGVSRPGCRGNDLTAQRELAPGSEGSCRRHVQKLDAVISGGADESRVTSPKRFAAGFRIA